MKNRLPLALSVTVLVVAVLGSTPIGQARGRALAKAIPFAQRAGFATKVGTANNAKALGGHGPTAFAVCGPLPDPRARPRRRHEPPVRQLLDREVVLRQLLARRRRRDAPLLEQQPGARRLGERPHLRRPGAVDAREADHRARHRTVGHDGGRRLSYRRSRIAFRSFARTSSIRASSSSTSSCSACR